MEQLLEDFIRRYGLLAVFVGGATEGDGTLVVSGALAHLGYFGFALATAVGGCGAVCNDCKWYALGRRGAGVVRANRFYKQAGPSVEGLVTRIGAWEILIARFVLGARIPSMIFWGTQHMAFTRFLAFDAAGCALWATILSGLGYVFSSSLALLLEDLERTERHVVILVAAVAAALLLRLLLRRGTRRPVSDGAEQSDPH
jgi:membrane protein DedA with SNARE-associated domain